jgi:hypothetical protein
MKVAIFILKTHGWPISLGGTQGFSLDNGHLDNVTEHYRCFGANGVLQPGHQQMAVYFWLIA